MNSIAIGGYGTVNSISLGGYGQALVEPEVIDTPVVVEELASNWVRESFYPPEQLQKIKPESVIIKVNIKRVDLSSSVKLYINKLNIDKIIPIVVKSIAEKLTLPIDIYKFVVSSQSIKFRLNLNLSKPLLKLELIKPITTTINNAIKIVKSNEFNWMIKSEDIE